MAVAASSCDDVLSLREEGSTALARGDVPALVRSVEALLCLVPTDTECGRALAEALVVIGPLYLVGIPTELRLRACSRAIEFDHRCVDAYIYRAELAVDAYDDGPERAISDLDRAIAVLSAEIESGASAPLLRRRSEVRCIRSRLTLPVTMRRIHLDFALDDASAAVDQSPEDPESYCCRAEVHMDRNDFDSAIYDLTRALELDHQNHARILCRRGTALRLKGLLEESLDDYNRSIDLGYDRALLMRSQALISMGLWDEGVESYRHWLITPLGSSMGWCIIMYDLAGIVRSLANVGDYASAGTRLGEYVAEFSDADCAVGAYARFVEIAGNAFTSGLEAVASGSASLADLANLADALRHASERLSPGTEDQGWRKECERKWAALRRTHGDDNEFVRQLDQLAMPFVPKAVLRAQAQYCLDQAKSEASGGRPGNALEWYRSYLCDVHDDAHAFLAAAPCCEKLNDLDMAWDLCDQALRAIPEDCSAHTHAQVLSARARYSQKKKAYWAAIADYTEAISTGARFPARFQHIGSRRVLVCPPQLGLSQRRPGFCQGVVA